MFYLSFLYEQTCVGINVDIIWKNLMCFFFYKKKGLGPAFLLM